MSRRMEWSGIGIIIPVRTNPRVSPAMPNRAHRVRNHIPAPSCANGCCYYTLCSTLHTWPNLPIAPLAGAAAHTSRYTEPWCSSPLAERSSRSTACSRRQTRTRTLTRSRSRRRKARRREVDALSGGAISGGAIKDVVCCLQQQGTKMRLLKQHPDGLRAALLT